MKKEDSFALTLANNLKAYSPPEIQLLHKMINHSAVNPLHNLASVQYELQIDDLPSPIDVQNTALELLSKSITFEFGDPKNPSWCSTKIIQEFSICSGKFSYSFCPTFAKFSRSAWLHDMISR